MQQNNPTDNANNPTNEINNINSTSDVVNEKVLETITSSLLNINNNNKYLTFSQLQSATNITTFTGNEPLYVFDLDYTLYCQSLNFITDIEQGFADLLSSKLNQTIDSDHVHMLEKETNEVDNRTSEGCLFRTAYTKNIIGEQDIITLHKEINFHSKLKQDIKLLELINSLEGRKVLMTNSIRFHIEECINMLGLESCFDYIIYCDPFGKKRLCKPMRESFEVINNKFNPKDNLVVFFDDSVKNVEMAESVGWKCELVDKENNIFECLSKYI